MLKHCFSGQIVRVIILFLFSAFFFLFTAFLLQIKLITIILAQLR